MAVSKKDKLNKIAKEIEVCKACNLCKNRIKSVVSKGNENAKIMLIGEAPGSQDSN